MEKYRIGDFAKRIGKSVSTVRRWDKTGRLTAKKHVSGHRYYDEQDVSIALNINIEKPGKVVVVYCRVSSKGQVDDLQSQIKSMETFCLGAGISVSEWIEEIGGGMNFKRKKFNHIIARIEAGEIGTLVIAHKDRFVRFGFDFFDLFAKRHGCKIMVVNQGSLSPQQEMVEDLMAIVHAFSCRLYGLRNYKKDIRKAANECLK